MLTVLKLLRHRWLVLAMAGLVALSLLGCSSLIYRPDLQQGNIVTQDMLNQLQPGMTMEQVRFIMGAPILVNTFDPARSDYVYTFRHNNDPVQYQRVTLQFQDGRLVAFPKVLPPKTVLPS